MPAPKRKPAAKEAAPKPTPAAPALGVRLLEPGEQAPDVAFEDHDGKPVRTRDLRGRTTVLYFYPADMTPGCTTESCEFQASLKAIEAAGAQVLGVSPDDAASHRKFRAKHGLEFPLLVADTKALEAFGVWQEKNLYGRKYMGVVRSTFVLAPDGAVRHAWYRVKPEGHAATVLDALRGR